MLRFTNMCRTALTRVISSYAFAMHYNQHFSLGVTPGADAHVRSSDRLDCLAAMKVANPSVGLIVELRCVKSRTHRFRFEIQP